MKTVEKVEKRIRGATATCLITIPFVLILAFFTKIINVEHLLFGLEISWLTSCVLFLTFYVPETIGKFRKKEA